MQGQNPVAAQHQITRLLYSKKEAAEQLNVSLRTIDNLIACKELAVRRVGRRVLIPHASIIAFVRTDHRIRKAA
jgi:excisionase family DNA binding protein